MCGIAGYFAADAAAPIDAELLQRMARALSHRGPDGEGVRIGAGYGLAHRRLSIIDLQGGAQPMADATGRVWVTYNGEIYNFAELRAELEARGHTFRTRCDTEVLVEGYRAWGAELPERLRGMFAFAIVDEDRRELFCARDRLGKKPLYWARLGDDVIFGSEPKALLCHPGLPRDVDGDALARFLCLRYVPDPHTIFRAVRRLPAGHTLTVRDNRATVRRYWRLRFGADPRPAERLAEDVLAAFDDAVRVRLMGDVPLGAFLSGGVDSFAVVDSMARVGGGRVVACTMGFDDHPLDERGHARAAARACGAELHEGSIDAAAMLDQAWLADVFDEPFADGSAVPTYHVSRLARRHVTVALSGDGGDESFAGYRRYRYDAAENRIRGLLPRALWRALGALYPKADFLPRFLRFKRTLQNLALDPAVAYARSVAASLPAEVLPLLRPEWRVDPAAPLAPVVDAYRTSDAPDPLARAAATDFATWLPGDILTKVDRASMAVGLEVRAPLLDHRLVELAAQIPSALKLRGGETKGFLRWTLRDRLGAAALRRPKQGFHVPLREWFRGPLGTALEAGLRDDALARFVEPDAVAAVLRRHRAGLRDHGEILWAVLSLLRFARRWLR